jgi:hypothetical protein
MPVLRRLNAAGIARFEEYVATLRGGGTAEPPTSALTNTEHSEPLSVVIEVEDKDFGTRLDWAKYIDGKLEGKGLKNVERDVGLWAWLALFYVKQLLPSKKNGRKEVGEVALWIPNIRDYTKYYRQLLAGPYRIYRAHRVCPEDALVLLGGPFGSHGEVVEQLASRLKIVTNRELIKAATALYWDADQGKIKRGAAANNKTPGSSARLAGMILPQFDLTWDLFSMTSEGILALLPKEFHKFKPKPVSAAQPEPSTAANARASAFNEDDRL